MKIYFAASIRGGREDIELYIGLIDYLKECGQVLTEHIADRKIEHIGEASLTDDTIHDRDLAWLIESDVVVAEVTTVSTGVGYEIAKAEDLNKPILCLYRPQEGKRLSAMIGGSRQLQNSQYQTLDDAKRIIADFFKTQGL